MRISDWSSDVCSSDLDAPVRAHWVVDRQSGPVLLKYGSEKVKSELIQLILRGEVYFCIDLTETNSGSDLFAASTKAVKTDGGWLDRKSKRLNTSNTCVSRMPYYA